MAKNYHRPALFLALLLMGVFGRGNAQNCITTQTISQGSNAFSQIFNGSNPIAVDPDLNTIVYIHRQNTGAFGGNSGNLRYDISSNGGATWTSNQGPVNPVLTSTARYPQVAIYNPANNTVPSNAYLVYQAPTIGTTWNGHVTGVRKLDGTGNTETYNQATATNSYIPAGLIEGAPGEFWSSEPIFDGTNYTGYRVFKGVFSGNNITWSVNTTFSIPFNTSNGAPVLPAFSIAFDPSGQFGWAGCITDLTTAPNNGALYPVFFRTTNGGQTWSGPLSVDLNSFPCIVNLFPANSSISSAFDMDMTVDINGNVHALLEAAIASTTTAYSITTDPFTYMVDITYGGGTFTAQPLAKRSNFRGSYGAANPITMDAHSQCSRTADGSKVFFFWTDSDSTLSAGTNDLPDLWGMSIDVVNNLLTDAFDFTSCSPAYDNQAWFPKMSAIALPTSSTRWIIPGTIIDLGPANDPLQLTDFVYMGNVFFETADYIYPLCVNTAIISSNGTLCGGSVTLTASAAGAYLWSTGATSQSINVTQPGTYSVTVSSNCCLSASASQVISGAASTVAAFSQTNTGSVYSFMDMSSNSPTSWSWDFGDGNTSTQQNPSHTYANPGTYQVCLTASNSCGSNTTCSTITISCNAPTPAFTSNIGGLSVGFIDQTAVTGSATYSWTFGDGGTSTIPSPNHTYANSGTYTVCLTVTDQCGTNTTCNNIVVSCAAPQANWGTTSSGNGLVTFADLSTNGPTSWAWTFGDGGTSSQQNPSHTYANTGTYTVCLTASSACGTDTYCDSISVVVVGLGDKLVQGIQVYPNPSNGQLGLSADFSAEGNLKIELMDVTGRKVLDLYEGWATQKYLASYDLSAIAAGIYYLKYEFGGETGMVKVLRK